MNQANPLPLLRFAPVFREYLWGGRRLGSVLGKPIGNGETYAESWEIVDHGDDQSIVAGGPFDGWSLSKLVRQHGVQLLGTDWYQKISNDEVPPHLQLRFPLLIKWLDSNKDLSIQVHPNDAQGAKLNPPDLGKTEAWYIADALPGAKVYAGLKSGVDHQQFATALKEDRIIDVLHSFEPKVGDCLFIPAGTAHALGAGLLVAEVQQASNTTYRIFDWNRVGSDGKARDLHVEQALEVTNYQAGPVHPQPLVESDFSRPLNSDVNASEIVNCPYFKIDRVQTDQEIQLPKNQTQIVMGLAGEAQLACEIPDQQLQIETLKRGETVLIPHCSGNIKVTPNGNVSILIARLP